MSEVLRWVAVALSVGVGLESFRRARTLGVGPAEERVFRGINNGPALVQVPVWAVMQAGSLAAVFVVGAALWASDEHPETAVVLVVGTVVWGGVKKLKPFVGRGRPGAHLDNVHVRGQAQTGLGYPSGHAAVSLTIALIATSGSTIGLQLAAIGVALFTGGARMYVGAHLPLDVVGGLAIGLVIGETVNAMINAWA